MAKGVTIQYEGPQQRIVALDRDVESGDEFTVPPEIAGPLLCAAGFTEKGAKPGADDLERLSRGDLEETADRLGLAVYPTEEDDSLASRILSHGGNPYKDPSAPAPESGDKS